MRRFSQKLFSQIEVPSGILNSKSGLMTSPEEIYLNIRKMQVPKGTGPGVRRSKRIVFATCIRCNVLWKFPEIW